MKLLTSFDLFIRDHFKIKVVEYLDPRSHEIERSCIYYIWFWEVKRKKYKDLYLYKKKHTINIRSESWNGKIRSNKDK